MPVTGLRYEKFAGSLQEPKYFIMATTPTRVYQFIGGPTFEGVFAKYETNPGFHELPGNGILLYQTLSINWISNERIGDIN